MKFVVTMVFASCLTPWATATAQTPPTSIDLSCEGRVSFNHPSLNYDPEKHRYGEDKPVNTPGRLGVKVRDRAVSVRLPSGAPGGGTWRDADHVEITPTEISGRVRGSRFTVDRRTGDVEMRGMPSFSGACEKTPDETAPAKF